MPAWLNHFSDITRVMCPCRVLHSVPPPEEPTSLIHYVGCFVDDPDRAFDTLLNSRDLAGCASRALLAGHSRFAMQFPQGRPDENAQCFYGDKGVLGAGPYSLRPDSECQGEDFVPKDFFGTEVPEGTPGSSFRNAVYVVGSLSDTQRAWVDSIRAAVKQRAVIAAHPSFQGSV